MACLVAFVLSVGHFVGCVVPPTSKQSVILPQGESAAIEAVRKGKAYIGTNRPELAEEQFRAALTLVKKSSSLWNDLGYSLQQQQRLPEAIRAYQEAINLDSQNIVAHENFGKVLYLAGDLDGSIKELDKALELASTLSLEAMRKSSGRAYDLGNRRELLRARATAEFQAGFGDEALCNSKAALAAGPTDFGQVSLHARLLLAAGFVGQAAAYLKDVIGVWQDGAPSPIFLDYGIATYALNQFEDSSAALERLVASKQSAGDEVKLGQLLLLAIKKRNQSSIDLEKAREKLSPEEVCAERIVDRDGYWPANVSRDANQVINAVCSK